MTNIVETFDPVTGGTTWSVHTAGMSKEQALKAAEALVRRSFENISVVQELRMKDEFGYTEGELGWVRERLAKATENAVAEALAEAASFFDSEVSDISACETDLAA
jgi:hypothetical protein